MEVIRANAKNPAVVGAAAFILGLIIGLVVLGWGLWPVKWTDAAPEHLSPEWKREFLRMSVEAYGQNGDLIKAKERYAALGKDAADSLKSLSEDPQGLNLDLLANFGSAIGSPVAPGPAVTQPALTTPQTTPALIEATPEKPAERGSSLPILFGALCLLLLVLVGFLAYMFLIRKRGLPGAAFTPARQADEARRQATYTDYTTTGEEVPIAQFMASYKLGDDLFDDSFSIDSVSGEFLGECGVGISETIGVGDHKKVTAFEVWLFDKNDIQTITKVLMSSHAFADPAIRQRLEAKGEPVLLEPGIETALETQTLQLVARVVDMSYGNGNMPDESYFDHLLLELAIWAK